MAAGIKFGSSELNSIKSIEQRINGAMENPDREIPNTPEPAPQAEEEKPKPRKKKSEEPAPVQAGRVGEREEFVELPSVGKGTAITLDLETYFAIQKMRMDNDLISIKKICYNLVREGLIKRGYLK